MYDGRRHQTDRWAWHLMVLGQYKQCTFRLDFFFQVTGNSISSFCWCADSVWWASLSRMWTLEWSCRMCAATWASKLPNKDYWIQPATLVLLSVRISGDSWPTQLDDIMCWNSHLVAVLCSPFYRCFRPTFWCLRWRDCLLVFCKFYEKKILLDME